MNIIRYIVDVSLMLLIIASGVVIAGLSFEMAFNDYIPTPAEVFLLIFAVFVLIGIAVTSDLPQ